MVCQCTNVLNPNKIFIGVYIRFIYTLAYSHISTLTYSTLFVRDILVKRSGIAHTEAIWVELIHVEVLVSIEVLS